MSQGVILSQRDLALLRLLDVTPATAAHIRKASDTFDGGAFRDGRRVRERLQTLANVGFVKSWPAAVPGGGLMSYYRLTLEGHRAAFPDTTDTPPRTSLHEIAPSRIRHAFATADVIVHCLVGCHRRNVRVLRALGDGRLTLQVGEYRQQPDFHLQLGYAGRTFNLVFEIDNATEPLDSHREQSIRTKILGYETYQDWVLRLWNESGEEGPRPSFRVAFLTTSAERANHILWLARELARNKDRRLVYASTQDAFLGEPLAVTQPILNDHHGHWQPLVNAQPSSRFLREPIYLRQPIAPRPGL
ncbi:MAG: replication-relaxation family protein [Candidatus Paceibacterota bacterium]